MMIDVVRIRRLGEHRLEIEFSDGTLGVRDFAELAQRTGPMVEPLKDASYFARVFVEDGALTWPNGYDWDPIALHDEMSEPVCCVRPTRQNNPHHFPACSAQ